MLITDMEQAVDSVLDDHGPNATTEDIREYLEDHVPGDEWDEHDVAAIQRRLQASQR